MNFLKALVLLVIGFVFLIKGADFFVDGASSLARKLRVPPLIIGLTIVAIGTSLPELSVSLSAAMRGQNALAVSNVIGSNIFNLLGVLGFSALFQELKVSRDVFKRDYPLSVIFAGLLLLFAFTGMTLGREEGIIFLALLLVYLVVVVREALRMRKLSLERELDKSDEAYEEELDEESETVSKDHPIWVSLVMIVGGAIAIKFGGDWVVDGAVLFAELLGISENIIGLTIVAIGTSLPELVTSIVAARRGELDMSVGNVVGSNIFNILGVLGVSASISPIAIITDNLIDLIVLIVFSLITLVFCCTGKRIDKKEGLTMILMYVFYSVYICMR